MAKDVYVYLFENGSLNSITNQFDFNESEIFSSTKKCVTRFNNGLKVNKGFDVVYQEFLEEEFSSKDSFVMYTYKTICVEGKESQVRNKITRKLLK